MKELIKVRNLWKRYGALQVLKGLDLDVYDQETVVILGRSGVGKSVLLKQLIGIEKPDQGSVEVDGVVLTNLSTTERYKASLNMGMLFQGAALFDSMTVGENVAFYLRQHDKKLTEKEIWERVDAALSDVGLQGVQDKMPSDLSGGMRKRAALARVTIYHPRIILYDEPTTGLDPVTSMQINDLINQAKEKLKATAIVVTHDIKSAMMVGDRLAFHDEGKIVQIAPKHEFVHLDDARVQAFFDKAVITEDMIQNG